MPPAKPPSRPAKEIIDDALIHNRSWERLCYVLVVLLVSTGLLAFATGIILGRDLVVLGGSGVAGLFWPAMWFARKVMRDNIRIRMYELALAMAKTPEEASAVLREALNFPNVAKVENAEEGPK